MRRAKETTTSRALGAASTERIGTSSSPVTVSANLSVRGFLLCVASRGGVSGAVVAPCLALPRPLVALREALVFGLTSLSTTSPYAAGTGCPVTRDISSALPGSPGCVRTSLWPGALPLPFPAAFARLSSQATAPVVANGTFNTFTCVSWGAALGRLRYCSSSTLGTVLTGLPSPPLARCALTDASGAVLHNWSGGISWCALRSPLLGWCASKGPPPLAAALSWRGSPLYCPGAYAKLGCWAYAPIPALSASRLASQAANGCN